MNQRAVLLTVLLTTSAAATTLPFHDDFQSGLDPAWTNLTYTTGLHGPVTPAYVQSGEAIVATRDQQQNWLTVQDDGNWPYYELSATIRFDLTYDDAHRAARLRFFQHGINNSVGWYQADGEYQVEFSVRDQQLLVVGQRNGSSTVFSNQPFAAQMSVDYRVKVRVDQDGMLRVWLNPEGDVEVLRAEVAPSSFGFTPLAPGGFTIDGSDCQMAVDDVSARSMVEIADGLMAYYPLDGDGIDYSGNSNHATSFGSVQPVGGACSGETGIQLDGLTGYLAAPPSTTLLPGAALTMSAWVRCNDPTGNMYVFYKETSIPYQNFSLRILENRIQCSFGVYSQHFQTEPIIFDQNWFHVLAMHDGEQWSMFLNGELVYSGYSTNNMDGDGRLLIGVHPLNTNYWDGTIDEARLYNRALTASEIAALSGCPPIIPQPPILHLAFNGTLVDEGSGVHSLLPTDVSLSATRGGRVQRAGLFNGATSQVEVAMSPALAGFSAADHTISAWVLLNESPVTNVMVVDASSPLPGGDQRGLRFHGRETPIFKWVTTSSSYQVEADVPIYDGHWHLVTGTLQGNTGSIYVDGVLRTTGISIGMPTPVEELTIGNVSAGGTNNHWFSGRLDEVMIFGRALTAEEILALAETPPDAPQPAHLPFSDDFSAGFAPEWLNLLASTGLHEFTAPAAIAAGEALIATRDQQSNWLSLVDDGAWPDYTVEADVRVDEMYDDAHRAVHLCLYQHGVHEAGGSLLADQEYRVTFSVRDQDLNISGKRDGASTTFVNQPYPSSMGVAYRLKAAVTPSGLLRVWLSASGSPFALQAEVDLAEHNFAPLLPGGLAVAGSDDRIALDNVSVYQTPADPPLAALPFTDDFSAGLRPEWTNLTYSSGLHGLVTPIYVENGEAILLTRDQQQNWLTLPDNGAWPVYTVEADVRVDELFDDAHGAVRLHCFQGDIVNNGSWYSTQDEYQVEFSIREQDLQVVGRHGGINQQLFSGGFAFLEDVDYHLVVAVSDQHVLRVWLNEAGDAATLRAAIDLDALGFAPLAPGSFTIEGSDCRLAIDDVHVYQTPTPAPIHAEIELLSPSQYRVGWNHDGVSSRYRVEYWDQVHGSWGTLAETTGTEYIGTVINNWTMLIRVRGLN